MKLGPLKSRYIGSKYRKKLFSVAKTESNKVQFYASDYRDFIS